MVTINSKNLVKTKSWNALIPFLTGMFHHVFVTPPRLITEQQDVVVMNNDEKMEPVPIFVATTPTPTRYKPYIEDTDLLTALKRSEARYRPYPTVKRKHDSCILLRNIKSVQLCLEKHGISRQSLNTAVNICQTVMNQAENDIKTTLLFETALWIGIKYDDSDSDFCDGMEYIVSTACCFKNKKRSVTRLIDTEMKILPLCSYSVNYVENNLFIEWFFSTHVSEAYNLDAEKVALYVSDLNLGKVKLLNYLPSEVAAACIFEAVGEEHHRDVCKKMDVLYDHATEINEILEK